MPVAAPGAFESILAEAHKQGTAWLLLALLLTRLFVRDAPRDQGAKVRFQVVLLLVCLHLLLLPATALASLFGAGVLRDLRLTGSVAATIAGVILAGMWVFRSLLPRLGLSVPASCRRS